MMKAVRWGILGTGVIAHSFAQDLQRLPDATIQAVGSRSRDSARTFADQCGATTAHESYEALVRDPEVDILYIATPHIRHSDDSLLCLEAGKPVLCEKPFALNAAQARAVFARAQERKLFCMEAMWMRFQPLVLEAKRLVDSGAIGRPRLLQADFGIAAPTDPNNRYFNAELGGGALLDLGVYPLSLAFLLLGEPRHVDGQATIGESGVDEQSTLTLTYPGPCLAVLTASLHARTAAEATLIGDEGHIRLHSPFYKPSRLSLARWPAAGPTPPTPTSAAGGRLRRIVRGNPLLNNLYERFGHLLAREDGETIRRPVPGNGYQFEAIETMLCLRGGLLESPLMPQSQTVRILETMDAVRGAWGLRYPAEGEALIPPRASEPAA